MIKTCLNKLLGYFSADDCCWNNKFILFTICYNNKSWKKASNLTISSLQQVFFCFIVVSNLTNNKEEKTYNNTNSKCDDERSREFCL